MPKCDTKREPAVCERLPDSRAKLLAYLASVPEWLRIDTSVRPIKHVLNGKRLKMKLLLCLIPLPCFAANKCVGPVASSNMSARHSVGDIMNQSLRNAESVGNFSLSHRAKQCFNLSDIPIGQLKMSAFLSPWPLKSEHAIGMERIKASIRPFEICASIITSDSIFVIRLVFAVWRWPNKYIKHEPVNQKTMTVALIVKVNRFVSKPLSPEGDDSVSWPLFFWVAHYSSEIADRIKSFVTRYLTPLLLFANDSLRHVQSFYSRLTVQASEMALTIRSPFYLSQ